MIEHTIIQFQAYLIYQEKGGSDLDNWLEAERFLKNNNQDVNSLETSNRRRSGVGKLNSEDVETKSVKNRVFVTRYITDWDPNANKLSTIVSGDQHISKKRWR